MNALYRASAPLALAVLLCGCGGSSTNPGHGGPASASSPPAVYTIGGTVSGLDQSGLVLLDNGADALSVPAGATSFTFATALAAGGAYSVSVQSAPSGTTCTVTNGSGMANADVSNVSVACTSAFAAAAANVVNVTVGGSGPAGASSNTFNIPYVTVKVCLPGKTTCATIDHVDVDTGSSGLRIMASVLKSAGLTLPPAADPNNSADTLGECLPFADGYAWGYAASADVTVGGESASGVPMQVIDDDNSYSAVPSACVSYGVSLDSVSAFDANGVIGVGVFDQDCGSACVSYPSGPPNWYYSCPATGSCTATFVPALDQVSNPVASFATDSNGVILQLPAIPASGATGATGYLVFGIGTQSNNGLGAATVLTTDSSGAITTSFNGQSLTSSFLDSGSNGLFFPDSTLSTCSGSPSFYCPSSSVALSATNQGQNGTLSDVSFSVANLQQINNTYFAIDDVGGPAAPIANVGSYFDWGLPFFYGRTIYTAIEGRAAGGTTGPYYAY